MAWVYRILLLLSLVFVHFNLPQHTISLWLSPINGIPPITDTTTPITADDLARSLVANPEMSVNQKMFNMSHSIRHQLGTSRDHYIHLENQQQKDAILMLRHLEKL